MKQYYISINQQSYGPFTLEQLAQDPQFSPETLVFTEGLANWVPAAQVPEFGQVFVSRNLAAQPMQYQAPMAPVQVAAPQKSNSSNTVIIIAVVALLLIGGGIASYFLFFNKNSHRSTDDYDEQTEEVASDTAWAEAAAEEAAA